MSLPPAYPLPPNPAHLPPSVVQAYLKLEDIYVGLASVRADMEGRSSFRRGQRQPRYLKVGLGCAMVTLLLLVVLGPLLLFSSSSPFSQPNPVRSVSVRLAVIITTHDPDLTAKTYGGGFELGSISRYKISEIDAEDELRKASFNEFRCRQATSRAGANLSMPCGGEEACEYCGYSYLLGDWNADYQLVQMANTSDMQWEINPHSLEAMRQLLLAGEMSISPSPLLSTHSSYW